MDYINGIKIILNRSLDKKQMIWLKDKNEMYIHPSQLWTLALTLPEDEQYEFVFARGVNDESIDGALQIMKQRVEKIIEKI